MTGSEPPGSDLASLRTRAVRHGDVYRVNGNKTWVTHGARADLLLLFVRTNPKETGHRGLSLLLAEKSRGSDESAFQMPGLAGSEIWVLGYRGMKEFEIGFDGFAVMVDAVGGVTMCLPEPISDPLAGIDLPVEHGHVRR